METLANRYERLVKAEAIIGFDFKEKELLRLALSLHTTGRRSMVSVTTIAWPDGSPKQLPVSTRQLRRMGDSLTWFLSYESVLAEGKKFDKNTQTRASNRNLSRYFDSAGLADLVDFGDSVNQPFPGTDVLKGNVVEAILAAIYLDQGLDNARGFFQRLKA